LAAEDAERSIVTPELLDPLSVLGDPPEPSTAKDDVRVAEPGQRRVFTDYLAQEARNRSLGLAGEQFVLTYESERLRRAGRDDLVRRIEHTAAVEGDGVGFDVRSFEVDGRDRLIEVKTTKYGIGTPFYVSRNELETSARRASAYQLYRLYAFRTAPRMYALAGPIDRRCHLTATTFAAWPR
jgi:hypothetical protein